MHAARRLMAAGLTGALALAGTLLASDPATAQEQPGTPAPAVVGRVEAESRSAQRGTSIVAVPRASGGHVVARISNGDWLRYDRVAVERVITTQLCFTANAAPSAEVATVDVRIGSRRATPVQSLVLRNYLGSGVRQAAFSGVPLPDGVHRVYLTVRQPRNSRSFELDYIGFYTVPPPPTLNC